MIRHGGWACVLLVLATSATTCARFDDSGLDAGRQDAADAKDVAQDNPVEGSGGKPGSGGAHGSGGIQGSGGTGSGGIQGSGGTGSGGAQGSGGVQGSGGAGSGGTGSGGTGSGGTGSGGTGSGGTGSGGVQGSGGMQGSGGAGGTTIVCASSQGCDVDFYCEKGADCDAPTGVCLPRPSSCGSEQDLHCGCDGVTYWNDCLRKRRRREGSAPGRCEVNAATCGSLSNCPPQLECALLVEECSIAAFGTCWDLPDKCPPLGSDVTSYRDCNGATTCVSLCQAIRSGNPHTAAESCLP